MNKIWLTSDLHLGHDRQFIWGPRGFNSVEEMNEAIVSRWNERVAPEDDVYILGDLMLGENEIGINYLRQLNGRIHVVLGNHDTPTRQAIYLEMPNIVEVEWAIMLNYKKYHFFMTHFPCMTGNLEKETLRQMTLNLYAHTHQKTNFYEDRPYMYHVGCDSHNCCPVLLDDIIQEMKDKSIKTDMYETLMDKWMRCNKCVFNYPECGFDDRKRVCPKYIPAEWLNKTPDIDAYCGDCEKRDNCRGPSLEDGCPPEMERTNRVETIRCDKCIYRDFFCGYTDYNGDCPQYKRDQPDGGYYG